MILRRLDHSCQFPDRVKSPGASQMICHHNVRLNRCALMIPLIISLPTGTRSTDRQLGTDRVFVHALNTVKKIPRAGTTRPPTSERLKLYGLYKQSMGWFVVGDNMHGSPSINVVCRRRCRRHHAPSGRRLARGPS